MPLTLKQLAEATELASSLAKLKRDIDALRNAYGEASIQVNFHPDPKDFNASKTLGMMRYSPPAASCLKMLMEIRDAFRQRLAEFGVSPE